MKKLLTYCLLLAAHMLAAQDGLKPVARMVLQAHENATVPSYSLFNKSALPISAIPELTSLPSGGILLDWDARQVTEVRSNSTEPVSVLLPWEDNSVVTLDLVPAKNFSSQFKVQLAQTGEEVETVDKGVHFWGMVRGDASSLVSLSLFEGEVIGWIVRGEEQYSIAMVTGRGDKKHLLHKEAKLEMPGGFTCHTDDELHRIGELEVEVENRASNPDNCVKMFIETDYTVFQNKGSVANVTSYMTGVMSQVSVLYLNESINLVLNTLSIWSVNDPYTGPSASNYLTQFRNAKNGIYDGDLAHLVGIHNLGGVAYLDVLCNAYYGVGYSSITGSYNNVPVYSWTIEVLTHEIGHNLGSPHTHACAWNGNNTALDGCGPTAGYSEGCTAPLPTNGGTVMSYCHLVSGVGINFNNGFGVQPGDRIRNEVYNASCLVPCGGGGGCTYTAINSNGFDASWGIWVDGGTDCARINNSAYANSPTFSIQLRDNTTSSVMTTTNQNWSSYEEITVDFSYVSVSFENGEDFWVQVATTGGNNSFVTKASFVAGNQFTNGVRQSASVVIPGPFSTATRLRFRADASDDDDQVYIDDVVITGCQQQFGGQIPERSVDGSVLEEPMESVSELWVGPNPASDYYSIRFHATEETAVSYWITDLSGKTIKQHTWRSGVGENQLTIPVNELSNGLYLVQVRAGKTVLTEKMVIAR